MIYDLKGRNITVTEFDEYDLLGSEHTEFGLEFLRRATLQFHLHYLCRHFQIFIKFFLKMRVWNQSWRACTRFFFKKLILSFVELLQAMLHGSRECVKQRVEM